MIPLPGEEQAGSLRSRAADYWWGSRIFSQPAAGMTRLIERYLAGEAWNDPEIQRQLSQAILTAEAEAARSTDDPCAGGFYHQAAVLLRDIQAEVLARRPQD